MITITLHWAAWLCFAIAIIPAAIEMITFNIFFLWSFLKGLRDILHPKSIWFSLRCVLGIIDLRNPKHWKGSYRDPLWLRSIQIQRLKSGAIKAMYIRDVIIITINNLHWKRFDKNKSHD